MIKSNKKIAVVIINYNGEKYLKKFLPSVVKFSDKKLSEIFIIDNNSSDGSINFIKKNYSKIKLIQNDKNYGYAKGYNIGLKKIKSEYIVLLNNDVEVTKNWLNPMCKELEKNKYIGTCQPKILSFNNKNYFEYAGASGGYLDFLGYPFCRGRIFNTVEEDNGQYDKKKEIFWSSGACMMIRNKLFKEAGGFDESFYAHMEEIDLCWRLQLKGHNIYVNPKSVIYHKNAVSLPMTSIKKFMLNHRNSLMMLLSNYKVLTTLYLFPIRYMLELVAILYALTKLDFRHMFGVIQAHLWILFHIHIIFYKRIKINRLRTIGDYEIMKSMYKGSIIWDHYIRRMKTYRDIFFSTSS